MKELSLGGFAGLMSKLAVGMPIVEHVALEHAALLLEQTAKEVIGTYEYGWTPLKPETVARKAHGDTPLLETGEMRDSIEHTVGLKHAEVGSNQDKAVWQEFGTSRGIPPRSFLGETAVRKGQECADLAGRLVYTKLIKG